MGTTKNKPLTKIKEAYTKYYKSEFLYDYEIEEIEALHQEVDTFTLESTIGMAATEYGDNEELSLQATFHLASKQLITTVTGENTLYTEIVQYDTFDQIIEEIETGNFDGFCELSKTTINDLLEKEKRK